MKEAQQILFERYLKSELSDSEKNNLESRLNSDSELKRDFEIYKEMNVFLEDKTSKGEALQVLRDVGGEERIPVRSNGFWWKATLGLFFILLLGFIINKVSKDNSEPSSYAELYMEPTWPVQRSGVSDSISISIAKYLQGDLNSATSELRALKTEDAHYWLAEIFAKEMVHDSVLKYASYKLSDITKRDKAYYLKIVALMMQGKHEKAKKIKGELPSDFNRWYLDRLKPNK